MNWDAIGAIRSILGAAAVFASLIYLAIQIRTQNRESRPAAMHEISVGARELMVGFSAADMAPIVVKVNDNPEQLSDGEALRFISLCGQLPLAWEEAFIQHQEGRLAERSWNSLSRYYANGREMAGMARAWVSRKRFFDANFVRFVDSQEYERYDPR